MLGQVKTIVQFHPKKKLINISVNGVTGKTYIVDGHRNYKNWERIKVGDRLGNLEWFDEEMKIIDADSNVSILK